jgi:DNA-binding HxlR family transcriptional regulator
MARKEFLNFLAPRQIAKRRYMRIMKNLASNPATWSEIKRSVQVLEGRTVNDRGITDLINTLVKAGFIEKTGELYQIGDPLLAEAIR